LKSLHGQSIKRQTKGTVSGCVIAGPHGQTLVSLNSSQPLDGYEIM